MKNTLKILFIILVTLIPSVRFADAQPVKTMLQEGHQNWVNKIIFSPDGTMTATADSQEVKIWKTSNGKMLQSFDIKRPEFISFSSDNKSIAVNEQIWNLETGLIEKTFGPKTFLSYSPDGKYLAKYVPDNNEIVLLSLPNNIIFKTLKRDSITHYLAPFVKDMGFSPQGQYFYFLPKGKGKIELWNMQSDEHLVVHSFTQPIPPLTGEKSISFSPDNSRISITSGNGHLLIWDMNEKMFSHASRTSETRKPGMIHRARFITDDVLWFYASDLSQVVNLSTEERISHIDLELGVSGEEVMADPSGKLLVVAHYGGNLKAIDLDTGRTIWTVDTLKRIPTILFSPDNKYIVSSNYKGHAKVYEASSGKFIKMIGQETSDGQAYGGQGMAFSKNGQLLALGTDEFLRIWDISSGQLVTKLGEKTPRAPAFFNVSMRDASRDIISIAFSNQENQVASLRSDNSIDLWDIKNSHLIRTIKREGHGFSSHSPAHQIQFSPDGTLLVFIETDTRIIIGGSNKTPLKILETATGKFLKTIEYMDVSSFGFSPGGKYLAVVSEGKTDFWETKTFELTHQLDNTEPYFAFSPDGKRIAYGGRHIVIMEFPNGKILKTIPLDRYTIRNMSFSMDGKYLSTSTYKGLARIWDVEQEECIVTFYDFPDASVIVSAEGFFSGSEGFGKYIHYKRELDIYEFNQFYDAFYRPDLIAEKLKGENISEVYPNLTIENALKNPPPQVFILDPKNGTDTEERTVSVKIRIKDAGGGIGDIRIHHNGKLIDSQGVYRIAKKDTSDKPIKIASKDFKSPYSMRNRGMTTRKIVFDKGLKKLLSKDFQPLSGTVERQHSVKLIKGENKISVSAFNGTNTVMSPFKNIMVSAKVPEEVPALFAITIGNDHFKDSEWDLSLARKDATDFSALLKKASLPLYPQIHETILLDTNKASVFESISAQAQQMKPEDVFVLYVATHGRAEDDLYYLFTSEFDGNLGSANPDHFITSIEIMELSKIIPALKQIFIFDTCHAGGVDSIVSGLYDARVSVFAKALGIHIFAGTKTYQEALDEYKGNGLFTHFVLSGLKGEADKNKDKEITVLELTGHLMTTVKEASENKQEPFIRNFGENLSITAF